MANSGRGSELSLVSSQQQRQQSSGGSDGPYSGSDGPYRGSDGPYRGSDGPYRGSDGPYRGSQPGPYPGSQPGPYPGYQPGPYPGSQPGPYPGSQPGPYPGSQPVPYGPAQPMSQSSNQSTTVVINQQSSTPSGPRPWSTGMCGCCEDMGVCFMGWCCPMILACQIASDLNESCCVPMCVNGGILALRTKLRIQNNIMGDIFSDSRQLCCCGILALCQMKRELNFIHRSVADQHMTRN